MHDLTLEELQVQRSANLDKIRNESSIGSHIHEEIAKLVPVVRDEDEGYFSRIAAVELAKQAGETARASELAHRYMQEETRSNKLQIALMNIITRR